MVQSITTFWLAEPDHSANSTRDAAIESGADRVEHARIGDRRGIALALQFEFFWSTLRETSAASTSSRSTGSAARAAGAATEKAKKQKAAKRSRLHAWRPRLAVLPAYCASTRVAGKATSTSVPVSTSLVMRKRA